MSMRKALSLMVRKERGQGLLLYLEQFLLSKLAVTDAAYSHCLSSLGIRTPSVIASTEGRGSYDNSKKRDC